MIRVIRKTIFWSALVFIGLTIFALTVGQFLPYEFVDNKVRSKFYAIILQGLPIAILLTFSGTFKSEKTTLRNFAFLGVTVLVAKISSFIVVFFVFATAFGAWTTVRTIYRHKIADRVIKEQFFDTGALGYGERRIVEIKPVLSYWILPTKVDTAAINRNEWVLVNEPGEVKFP